MEAQTMTGSKLNAAQRICALNLLAHRPAVLPGTRAILNDKFRVIWYTGARDSSEEYERTL